MLSTRSRYRARGLEETDNLWLDDVSFMTALWAPETNWDGPVTKGGIHRCILDLGHFWGRVKSYRSVGKKVGFSEWLVCQMISNTPCGYLAEQDWRQSARYVPGPVIQYGSSSPTFTPEQKGARTCNSVRRWFSFLLTYFIAFSYYHQI